MHGNPNIKFVHWDVSCFVRADRHDEANGWFSELLRTRLKNCNWNRGGGLNVRRVASCMLNNCLTQLKRGDFPAWRLGQRFSKSMLRRKSNGKLRCSWEDNIKMGFKRWDGEALTGLLWLRIGTAGGRLWMRQWTPEFYKTREFLD